MKKQCAVMDGNTAAARVACAFTEAAAIYPITPLSPVAEKLHCGSNEAGRIKGHLTPA